MSNKSIDRESIPILIISSCIFSNLLYEREPRNLNNLLKYWKGITDRKAHFSILKECIEVYQATGAVYAEGIKLLELYLKCPKEDLSQEIDTERKVIDKASKLYKEGMVTDALVLSALSQELNYYVVATGMERIVKVVEQGADTKDIANVLQSTMDNLYTNLCDDTSAKSLKEIVDEILGDQEEVSPLVKLLTFNASPSNSTDLTYGVPDWEKAGLRPYPTEATAVVAPQNGGKTAYCCQLAYANAIAGAKVLIISTEEAQHNITQNITRATGVSLSKEDKYNTVSFEFDTKKTSETVEQSDDEVILKSTKKKNNSVYRLNRAEQLRVISEVTSLDIPIKHYAPKTTSALEAVQYINGEFNAGKNYDLIIVDHFHGFDFGSANSANELKTVMDSHMAAFKAIATQRKCAVIVFCQSPHNKEWHYNLELNILGSATATQFCATVISLTHCDSEILKNNKIRILQSRKYRKTTGDVPISIMTVVDTLHGDSFKTFRPISMTSISNKSGLKVSINDE